MSKGKQGRFATRLSMTTALAIAAGGLMAGAAHAQQQGATQVLQDEIVITATKRGETMVQDVPLAVTAYSAEQLEAMNFQDLQTLTYSMPNVQLEDIGTARNVANFSIRGIGINSSIPSVDPTVGVFVDGMYLGINAGVLTDNFDLEAVEVLRGPQGTLYGRNVTGGAVLVRSRAPTDELEIRARAGVETGPQYNADFSISGPIAPGVVSGKLAVYHSQDEGWHENDFNGSQFGESETSIYRAALRFTPTDTLEMLLRLEQGNGTGDGPAAQNHGLFSRDSFDFSINYPGYGSANWEQAIFETNWDVGIGNGTITNIAGWRQYTGLSGGDIDSTPNTAFHSRAVTEQDQWSNELRYAGTFGNVDVTLGGYYFNQNLFYIEERFLLAGLLPIATPSATSPLQYAAADPFFINRVGGGEGRFSTTGFFANTDWHLNEQITLSFGARYTYEQ
ncbi:MAG: TonB-dependent receptor, partial [Hyphomonadaceae bacterium]